MSAKSLLLFFIVGIPFFFGIAFPAFSQETEDCGTTLSEKTSQWTIFGGGDYQWDADIDDGGNFNVTGGKIGLRIKKSFSENLHLDTFSVFSVDSYNFSDTTALGGDPWGDVSNIIIMPVLNYALTDQWVILGGGIFNASYEKDANEDNDNGGGVIGFKYIVTPDLTVGASLAVIGQEESDTLVIPVPHINWCFAENWYFKSGISSFAADFRASAEAGTRLSDQFNVSLTTEIRYKRFRLDEEGVVPNGFGKDKNIPVYLTFTWVPKPNIAVEMSAGGSTGGELAVEDINGKKIWREDYDPAVLAGLFLSCDF